MNLTTQSQELQVSKKSVKRQIKDKRHDSFREKVICYKFLFLIIIIYQVQPYID